jgi:tetratricopeptide (TPR) repeat protein
LIGVELETALGDDRIDLRIERARLLHEAGVGDEAKSELSAVEQEMLQSAAAQPSDAALRRKLAEVYVSAAFGPDLEKALEMHRAARRLDPGIDSFRLTEAGLLYQLKRYPEAWTLYSKAIRQGVLGSQGNVHTLYEAGFAAHHAGQRDAALRLMRQALWRAPEDQNAARASELIRDTTTTNEKIR